MTKTCTVCLKEKPRDQFYDNISCADGFTPKCKVCSRKMNKYYYQQRKLRPKERLPFVYLPRAPLNPKTGSDLDITVGPIRIDFD
jgi:hypothetical protein